MKVQMNPTNKQKFVNLPKELCNVLNINQGSNISFKLINKKTLLMILNDAK